MENIEQLRRAMASRIAEQWEYQPSADEVDEEFDELGESIFEAFQQGYKVGFLEVKEGYFRGTIQPYKPSKDIRGLNDEELWEEVAVVLIESAKEWGDALLDLVWLREVTPGTLSVVKVPFRPDVEIVR